MKLKKISITLFLIFLCTLQIEAKSYFKNNDLTEITIIPIKSYPLGIKSKCIVSGCDDDYAWQVSVALAFLEFNFSNPPSGANSSYYDWAWGNYNYSLSVAAANRKACKKLSAN